MNTLSTNIAQCNLILTKSSTTYIGRTLVMDQCPVLKRHMKHGPLEVRLTEQLNVGTKYKQENKIKWIKPFNCEINKEEYSKATKSGKTKGTIDFVNQEMLWKISSSYRLNDFSPDKPPYVPFIIQIIVNHIENKCKESNTWYTNYKSPIVMGDPEKIHERANNLLRILIFKCKTNSSIDHRINEQPVEVLTSALRQFLDLCRRKVIHLNLYSMKELSKSPLRDSLLRPNIQVKRILMNVILTSTRTSKDTLSFLMLHMHNVLKQSSQSEWTNAVRHTLAKNMGPYLVSFDNMRKFYSKQVDVRVAVTEVVMELCDCDFWQCVSQSQARKAFVEQRETKSVTRSSSKKYDTQILLHRAPQRVESMWTGVEMTDTDYQMCPQMRTDYQTDLSPSSIHKFVPKSSDKQATIRASMKNSQRSSSVVSSTSGSKFRASGASVIKSSMYRTSGIKSILLPPGQCIMPSSGMTKDISEESSSSEENSDENNVKMAKAVWSSLQTMAIMKPSEIALKKFGSKMHSSTESGNSIRIGKSESVTEKRRPSSIIFSLPEKVSIKFNVNQI